MTDHRWRTKTVKGAGAGLLGPAPGLLPDDPLDDLQDDPPDEGP